MRRARGPEPFLFTWRRAFSSDKGPPALTRLVLWVLSKHMEADGSGCFASQQLLASEAGMALRSAKAHLQAAERLGWIERQPRRRGDRQHWRFGTDYMPRIPARAIGAPAAPNASPNIGAPDANIGASGATLVHQMPTRSSGSTSPEVNAFRKEGSTPPVIPSTEAAQIVQQRRAARDEFVAGYERVEAREGGSESG